MISAATNEWKSLRHAADVGPSIGLISVDHSSLSKHMKSLDYAIMKRIFEVIVGKLNRAIRRTYFLRAEKIGPLNDLSLYLNTKPQMGYDLGLTQ